MAKIGFFFATCRFFSGNTNARVGTEIFMFELRASYLFQSCDSALTEDLFREVFESLEEFGWVEAHRKHASHIRSVKRKISCDSSPFGRGTVLGTAGSIESQPTSSRMVSSAGEDTDVDVDDGVRGMSSSEISSPPTRLSFCSSSARSFSTRPCSSALSSSRFFRLSFSASKASLLAFSFLFSSLSILFWRREGGIGN